MEVFNDAENEKKSRQPWPFKLQYRLAEAAAWLSMSERSLRYLMDDGLISSYRIKGSRFIARAELVRFVKESSTQEAIAHG